MYNINVNMSLVRVIESWATTENPFNSTDEILAWIQEKNKAVEVSIRKIPYDYSGENWHYDSERGEIRNKTGSFFRIKGLQKIVDEQPVHEQPIILQNEIGYLPQQTIAQKDFPASVYEVVLSGRLNSLGFRPFYSRKDKQDALEKMKLMGIDHLKNKCYYERLSKSQFNDIFNNCSGFILH